MSGLEATAYIKTDTSSPSKTPDIQIHFFSASPAKDERIFDKSNIKPEVCLPGNQFENKIYKEKAL